MTRFPPSEFSLIPLGANFPGQVSYQPGVADARTERRQGLVHVRISSENSEIRQFSRGGCFPDPSVIVSADVASPTL